LSDLETLPSDIEEEEAVKVCLDCSSSSPSVQIYPGVVPIDCRCDNRRFWLSAHDCQVPTPTSQNPEVEKQIRIFGAD
jgi:hypothetical protein